VQVKLQEPCDEILYSRACVHAGNTSAMVTIAGGHTRVVEIVCQGETRFVLNEQPGEMGGDPLAVFSHHAVADRRICGAGTVRGDPLYPGSGTSERCALSRRVSGKWGLHIGATLHKQRSRGWMAQDLGSDIVIRTSAASDARMGGATLPAMSNSGSGNQGITATMPVVVWLSMFRLMTNGWRGR
jgi:L-cysteine desulfidase